MKKYIYYVMVSFLGIIACNKDNYFVDSGIHNPNFKGSLMEYLDSKAQRPIDPFDTLVQVIRFAGLEETLSKEDITFFALPDPCINKAIKDLNLSLYFMGHDTVRAFQEVKPEVWRYFLTQYMIRGDYGLIDIPQVDTLALFAFPGQLYQTLNTEEPLNVGVVYHDLKNEGSTIKYKGPRQLLISYIPDFAEPKKGWYNTFISSANIKPYNGRVHVVNYNRHTLGFQSYRFVRMAMEYGIDYLTD